MAPRLLTALFMVSLAFSGFNLICAKPAAAAETLGLDTPPPDASAPTTPATPTADGDKPSISNPAIANPADAGKAGNAFGESDELTAMRKNAAAGDKEAQLHLGEHYDQRMGLNADFGEAARWYQRAAAQGQPDAEFKLGECYAKALGLAQNYEAAYFWLSLGTVTKRSKAYAAVRDEVAKSLTPEQIAASKQKMAAWKPSAPKPVALEQPVAAAPITPAGAIAFPAQLPQ